MKLMNLAIIKRFFQLVDYNLINLATDLDGVLMYSSKNMFVVDKITIQMEGIDRKDGKCDMYFYREVPDGEALDIMPLTDTDKVMLLKSKLQEEFDFEFIER